MHSTYLYPFEQELSLYPDLSIGNPKDGSNSVGHFSNFCRVVGAIISLCGFSDHQLGKVPVINISDELTFGGKGL